MAETVLNCSMTFDELCSFCRKFEQKNGEIQAQIQYSSGLIFLQKGATRYSGMGLGYPVTFSTSMLRLELKDGNLILANDTKIISSAIGVLLISFIWVLIVSFSIYRENFRNFYFYMLGLVSTMIILLFLRREGRFSERLIAEIIKEMEAETTD